MTFEPDPAPRRRVEFYVPPSARLTGCKSCGVPVWWIRTAAGRHMPLSQATVREDESGRRFAESHFADCPFASCHRRGPR